MPPRALNGLRTHPGRSHANTHSVGGDAAHLRCNLPLFTSDEITSHRRVAVAAIGRWRRSPMKNHDREGNKCVLELLFLNCYFNYDLKHATGSTRFSTRYVNNRTHLKLQKSSSHFLPCRRSDGHFRKLFSSLNAHTVIAQGGRGINTAGRSIGGYRIGCSTLPPLLCGSRRPPGAAGMNHVRGTQ